MTLSIFGVPLSDQILTSGLILGSISVLAYFFGKIIEARSPTIPDKTDRYAAGLIFLLLYLAAPLTLIFSILTIPLTITNLITLVPLAIQMVIFYFITKWTEKPDKKIWGGTNTLFVFNVINSASAYLTTSIGWSYFTLTSWILLLGTLISTAIMYARHNYPNTYLKIKTSDENIEGKLESYTPEYVIVKQKNKKIIIPLKEAKKIEVSEEND